MTETSDEVQVDPEVLIATAEELEPVAYRLHSKITGIRDQFGNLDLGDHPWLDDQSDPVLVAAVQRCAQSLRSATLTAEILSEVVKEDSFSLVETALAFQEADLVSAEQLEQAAPGRSVDGGYR